MIKLIVGGTLTYGVAALINKYLLETTCKEESKKEVKELKDAVEEYQEELKEWKEKKDKLLLEKPRKELENFEEALEEWKTKVGELEEPKITDYYDPTRNDYRMYVSAITAGLVCSLIF